MQSVFKVTLKASLKNTKSTSADGNKTKKYVHFDCMQFLDKKHIVDTEDSIVESQNTINESQPTSEIVTKNDALNSTLPSTSEGSNFCKPKQTATAERKNVQARRKRIRDEDRNFEREMMNMFKEYTKLMQTMTCHFFVRFCRL